MPGRGRGPKRANPTPAAHSARVHAKIGSSAHSLRADSHIAPPSPEGRASTKIPTMDIERINAIGNHIADLSERTTALRGYL
jgi:hypothetical protein